LLPHCFPVQFGTHAGRREVFFFLFLFFFFLAAAS